MMQSDVLVLAAIATVVVLTIVSTVLVLRYRRSHAARDRAALAPEGLRAEAK